MILVVGGGIFGVSAANELRARGQEVTLVDQGRIPHPLAESTDVSKAVRMDYGPDEAYAEQMERALVAWRRSPFFHETGTLYLSRSAMQAGRFEHEGYELLTRRGHRLQRIRPDELRRRFPAWNAELFIDGYYNPEGGWAESGRVVADLCAKAQSAGVRVLEETKAELLLRGDRVAGVVANGKELEADHVVVASGAWAERLVPWLKGCFKRTGQSVFLLRPSDPTPFAPERFPTYGADISTTGYYGFPALSDGRVKIANHGPGREVDPDGARDVPAADEAKLRAFLKTAFPLLADAPVAENRTCIYCDTRDEHFWIAQDPQHQGLTVATGGSGHAFKFAPLLGPWIADAVLGVSNPDLPKFRWRPELISRGEEAARAKS
jgi:glycine/D-amino acid oxidase-like deaminating enzyme